MKKLKPLALAILALSGTCVPTIYAAPGLSQMTDEQLSDTTGQALMSLSYLAPNAVDNLESQRTNGDKAIGFYKLGLEAELEINANIKKLQLGCGGVNGANGCDIDIDNLSLSGQADTNTGRASSSAKLTNPFLEFAVKNPDSAAKREIVGLRVSAEKAVGLLTAGTENSNKQNGINSISGFMRIQSDSSGYVYGLANTGAKVMDLSTYKITGKIDPQIPLFNALLDIETVGGKLNIPAMKGIPFIRNGVTVNDNRVKGLPLQATLNIPSIKLGWESSGYSAQGTTQYAPDTQSWNAGNQIPTAVETLGGPLSAKITDCNGPACLLTNLMGTVQVGAVLNRAYLKGDIINMSANVTIDQGLGYIHYLPINSAFSLSLQSQAVKWPGSYSGANPERVNMDGTINTGVAPTISDIAQKGWWMSFSDPINLGSVNPTDDIDIEPLFPQIAANVSNQLNATPANIGIGSLINAVGGLGGYINVSSNDIDLQHYPLNLSLSNLQLNGQNFKPNCYGGLKFC